LVVSAIWFYVPRALWLVTEGGLMKYLAKGTTSKIIENADKKREELIQTFQEHLHNKYNRYALSFICFEQFNLACLFAWWMAANGFLQYRFFSYGPAVVRYYSLPFEERQLIRSNPMCEAFPRVTSCGYHRYGTGGGEETKQAICILGLNMINDKIFLVLWFWGVALIFVSLHRICYRLLQISPLFRYFLIKNKIYR